MEHLLILSYLVILFVGTWAAFLARQAHQVRAVTIARPVFFYLTFFNVMVFVILAGRYSATNMFMEKHSTANLIAHIGLL
ncbi:MAG: hypothetical protein ACFFCW_38545, partial [Candidatus Hodarchaeota archaeon]